MVPPPLALFFSDSGVCYKTIWGSFEKLCSLPAAREDTSSAFWLVFSEWFSFTLLPYDSVVPPWAVCPRSLFSSVLLKLLPFFSRTHHFPFLPQKRPPSKVMLRKEIRLRIGSLLLQAVFRFFPLAELGASFFNGQTGVLSPLSFYVIFLDPLIFFLPRYT